MTTENAQDAPPEADHEEPMELDQDSIMSVQNPIPWADLRALKLRPDICQQFIYLASGMTPEQVVERWNADNPGRQVELETLKYRAWANRAKLSKIKEQFFRPVMRAATGECVRLAVSRVSEFITNLPSEISATGIKALVDSMQSLIKIYQDMQPAIDTDARRLPAAGHGSALASLQNGPKPAPQTTHADE